jgi:CspA family cold shock protein
MPSGTVKWFNTTKGYGFVQPDDGGKDVFIHITAVQAAGLQGLDDGQRLNYELETDEKRGRTFAGNLQLE